MGIIMKFSNKCIVFFLAGMLFVSTACSSSKTKEDSPAEEIYNENQLNNIIPNDAEEVMPWDNGGKTPDQYTWEELQALTDIQKEYFFEWFDSAEEYEKWLNNARPKKPSETMPWDNGGKPPDQYTWEEMQALTDVQKERFFEWFESAEKFETWADSTK